MANKRVFSEQEAAEIMQRAVRMQETSPKSDYTPGITEDELRKIAIEAGIDAAFIEKAIAGIDTEEKSKTGLFNMTEEFERVVEGEMDPKDFDTILNMVKRSGRAGMMQVGRTLTGQGFTGVHMVTVNVESRKGRTKLKVKYVPFSAYFIGLHLPIIASMGIIGGFAGAGQPWLGVGIAGGLFGIGSLVFSWLVKAGRRAAKKLTGEIAETIRDEVDPLRTNLESSSAKDSEEQEKQTT